jgi:hypothetical protein
MHQELYRSPTTPICLTEGRPASSESVLSFDQRSRGEISKKQQAIELLKEGVSVRSISDQTGLSRRQVGKLMPYTSDILSPFVEPPEIRISLREAAEEIFALTVRSQGAKRSEFGKILKARFGVKQKEKSGKFGLDMSPSNYTYLIGKVKALYRDGLRPLITPEWMPLEQATVANTLILQLAISLQESITDMVFDFCDQFPEVSVSAVRKELMCLVNPERLKEPVQTRCDRNQSTAEELASRMPLRLIPPRNQEHLFDPEFESLCV